MRTMTYEDIKWPDIGIGKCCHTVLAMATGRDIREIVEFAESIGLAGDRMSLPCMRVACRKMGLNIKSWEIYRGYFCEGNEFPPTCLVFTKVNGCEEENGVPVETAHVLLRVENVYFDPQHHKSTSKFPLGQRITHYAEIDTFRAEREFNYRSQWMVNTLPIKDIKGY